MVPSSAIEAIRRFTAAELSAFVTEHVSSLLEDEALAILDNAHCSAAVCQMLARNPRRRERRLTARSRSSLEAMESRFPSL